MWVCDDINHQHSHLEINVMPSQVDREAFGGAAAPSGTDHDKANVTPAAACEDDAREEQ